MRMRVLCALCIALAVVHNTQGAEVAELASLEDGYVVVPMHAGEVADSNGKIHQVAKPKEKVATAKPKPKPKAAHEAKPKAAHEAKPKAAGKPPTHPAKKHSKKAKHEKKAAPAKKVKKHEKKAKKHEKKKRLPVQPKQNPQEAAAAQRQQQKHEQQTWSKDVMKYHEKNRRSKDGQKDSKAKTPWQKAVTQAGSHHKHHRRKHELPHHDPVPGPVLKLKPKKVHHPKQQLAAIEKTERKDAAAKLKQDDKREEALEGQIMGVKLQNQAHIAEHKADVAQKESVYERASSAVRKDTHIEHHDESKALDAQMLVGTPGELGESSTSDSLPSQVERILYGPAN